MRSLIDLPDINVWLALCVPGHSKRVAATHYWREESKPRLTFVPTTMLGLLRLLMNPPTMDGNPLSRQEAWAAFESWKSLPEVEFAFGSLSTVQHLGALVPLCPITRDLWADAYLAATAIKMNARLVTFDRDFRKFDGLDLLLLTE